MIIVIMIITNLIISRHARHPHPRTPPIGSLVRPFAFVVFVLFFALFSFFVVVISPLCFWLASIKMMGGFTCPEAPSEAPEKCLYPPKNRHKNTLTGSNLCYSTHAGQYFFPDNDHPIRWKTVSSIFLAEFVSAFPRNYDELEKVR